VPAGAGTVDDPEGREAPAGAGTVDDPESPGGPSAVGLGDHGGTAPLADSAGKAPVDHQLVVPSTRTSSTWTGIGIGLFALLVVIGFIGQNTQKAPINFAPLHGSFPVGLAVLLAFVLGGIVVLLLGVARLAQLRLVARRHRRSGRV
jgi:lipopolysaccharide assembly protein A